MNKYAQLCLQATSFVSQIFKGIPLFQIFFDLYKGW